MQKLLIPFVAVALLAGCGGKSEAEKEKEKQATGRGTVTCDGSATSKPTSLPAGFPTVEGATYVSVKDSGPTHVVDGYVEKGLKDLYDRLESDFGTAGYTILFKEREEDDAEISYKTKDGTREGQVALRSCDEDKTSIHVTARPVD
jgi:hypothetical protein